jgi:peptide/nickel transport system permease protein
LDFTERSWEQQRPVGEIISASLPPTLMITVPSLVLTAAISIIIGLICAFRRGRPVDRGLMVLAVLGMSISYLVYIIIGQYFGAFWLTQQTGRVIFKVDGYDQNLSSAQFWLMNPTVAAQSWITYCALPVMIGVIVAMGYDTRFYRAVMVEETTRDYITTARAKGAPDRKIMFVHMLKNAMIPIITRVMITLPFLIEGSILVEMYFGIPGMGRTLITAINAKDFPIVQSVTAVFAGVVIITVILTDVLYALVDPRVRLR